jgi:hypothetical protein
VIHLRVFSEHKHLISLFVRIPSTAYFAIKLYCLLSLSNAICHLLYLGDFFESSIFFFKGDIANANKNRKRLISRLKAKKSIGEYEGNLCWETNANCRQWAKLE